MDRAGRRISNGDVATRSASANNERTWAVSGSRDAYSYLPESIRKFPGAEDLARAMREAGFASVEFDRLTFGAVALHIGRK